MVEAIIFAVFCITAPLLILISERRENDRPYGKING